MRRVLALLLLALLIALHPIAPARADDGATRAEAFLSRVFAKLPSTAPTAYTFKAWQHADDATKEAVGLVPLPAGVSVEKLVARVMDVNHYVGNLDHVTVSRSIPDGRFTPPQSVRFYQRVNVPLIGDIQHELALIDGGLRQSYRVIYWYDLATETAALSTENGARSAYSVGCWLITDKTLGYALSNVPRREDVSTFEWSALTTGADLTASPVFEANLEGLIAWAKKGA